MGENAKIALNLGCGLSRMEGWVNVDAFGNPDVRHDLNITPWPWSDNSVDRIRIFHVLEHLSDWWGAFSECARILAPGGELEIRVPDESSSSALTYRDHCNVFAINSFFGIHGELPGNNAWAAENRDSVPLVMLSYHQVPFKEYEWMTRWCPRILLFCSKHMRNFIWEQRFTFKKVG